MFVRSLRVPSPSFASTHPTVWESEEWLKQHAKPLAQSGGMLYSKSLSLIFFFFSLINYLYRFMGLSRKKISHTTTIPRISTTPMSSLHTRVLIVHCRCGCPSCTSGRFRCQARRREPKRGPRGRGRYYARMRSWCWTSVMYWTTIILVQGM